MRPVITPRFIPSCSDDLLERLGQARPRDRLPCPDALLRERLGAPLRAGPLRQERHRGAGWLRPAGRGARYLRTATSSATMILRDHQASRRRHRALPAVERLLLGCGVPAAADPAAGRARRARHRHRRRRQSLGARERPPRGDHIAPAGVGRRPVAAPGAAAPPRSRIDASTAFWLATAGGGIAADLPIGVFRDGFQFDAVLIDASGPGQQPADRRGRQRAGDPAEDHLSRRAREHPRRVGRKPARPRCRDGRLAPGRAAAIKRRCRRPVVPPRAAPPKRRKCRTSA